jgi:hypothetical protein
LLRFLCAPLVSFSAPSTRNPRHLFFTQDTHYRGGELYFRAMAAFMTDALRVTGVFEPSLPASTSSGGHAASLASGGGVKSPRASDA